MRLPSGRTSRHRPVGQQVASLRKRDYLNLKRDPDDGRARRVWLTSRAEDLIARESLRLHPANGDALGVLREVCGSEVLTAFLAADPQRVTPAGRYYCEHVIVPWVGEYRSCSATCGDA
jgi:hypothetical protein